MPPETMTVTVPRTLVDQFRQRAQQRQHSLEEELVEALVSVVTADGRESSGDVHVPSDTAEITSGVAPAHDDLTVAADEALWHVAQTNYPSPAASAYLEELNFKRQSEGLTAEEEHVAATLLRQADRQMLLRSEALALLKERGHDISPLLRPVTR